MYFFTGISISRSRPHLTNINIISPYVLEKRHQATSDLGLSETKLGLPKQKLPNVVHGVHCNQKKIRKLLTMVNLNSFWMDNIKE